MKTEPMKTEPMRSVAAWAALLVASLWVMPAAAQTDEEASPTQPVLAIGAFGLGAVDAVCLAPAVINIAMTADGGTPPSGTILVGYICAAVQISGGLAYALRDGPGWQQTIGAVTTGFGAVSLGGAIVGSLAPEVEVAGARVRAAPWTVGLRPGEQVWGLTLSIR